MTGDQTAPGVTRYPISAGAAAELDEAVRERDTARSSGDQLRAAVADGRVAAALLSAGRDEPEARS